MRFFIPAPDRDLAHDLSGMKRRTTDQEQEKARDLAIVENLRRQSFR
jgi:hypothetical protein